MATLRRCMAPGCGHFHDKRDPECPNCGTPRTPFSSHLYTAKLNNNLYDNAARVDAAR